MDIDTNSIELIAKILVTPGKRTWIEHGDMRIYVRHGFHRLGADLCVENCLDVANVESETRGQGNFTLFLTQLEQLVLNCPSCDVIYVESIMNRQFADFLKRRGYAVAINSNMLAPNMFKKFKAADAS